MECPFVVKHIQPCQAWHGNRLKTQTALHAVVEANGFTVKRHQNSVEILLRYAPDNAHRCIVLGKVNDSVLAT
jgi:hypothetical protein